MSLPNSTLKTSDARKIYISDIEDALAHKSKQGKQSLRAMSRAVHRYPANEFNEPDENVLVWSDLHLGHTNIIQYTNRPFAHRDEMDNTLWENLRAAMTPDKVLVVVGDMAMGPALVEATWHRIHSLACRHRHLVIGNHDITGSGLLRLDGFDYAWSLMVSTGEPPLIWTHYPLTNVPDGYVNIHGHEHNSPPAHSPHINVSVEQLDYRPVRLVDLRTLARALVVGMYPQGTTTIERILSLNKK